MATELSDGVLSILNPVSGNRLSISVEADQKVDRLEASLSIFISQVSFRLQTIGTLGQIHTLAG